MYLTEADRITKIPLPNGNSGDDAGPLLGWRASLSDEDWIASAGMDEETWIAGMRQFGADVRPYLKKVA